MPDETPHFLPLRARHRAGRHRHRGGLQQHGGGARTPAADQAPDATDDRLSWWSTRASRCRPTRAAAGHRRRARRHRRPPRDGRRGRDRRARRARRRGRSARDDRRGHLGVARRPVLGVVVAPDAPEGDAPGRRRRHLPARRPAARRGGRARRACFRALRARAPRGRRRGPRWSPPRARGRPSSAGTMTSPRSSSRQAPWRRALRRERLPPRTVRCGCGPLWLHRMESEHRSTAVCSRRWRGSSWRRARRST